VAKRFETGVIDVIQDQGGHTKIVAEDLRAQAPQSKRSRVLVSISG
jgi:hypothetical protein